MLEKNASQVEDFSSWKDFNFIDGDMSAQSYAYIEKEGLGEGHSPVSRSPLRCTFG